jgi:hypothetical protein
MRSVFFESGQDSADNLGFIARGKDASQVNLFLSEGIIGAGDL